MLNELPVRFGSAVVGRGNRLSAHVVSKPGRVIERTVCDSCDDDDAKADD